MADSPVLVRAGTLPGRLVIALQDGSVLGICRRAIEDPFLGRVLGFAFEDDEWYEGPKFLPQQAVVGYGENALLLEDRSRILELHQAAEIRLILKQRESFVEKHVMTDDGKYLGEIFDYEFDRHGTVVHYYLHRYLAGEGDCVLVPAARTSRVGKNLVLVAEGPLKPTPLEPGVRNPWEAVRAPRIPPTQKSLEQLRLPGTPAPKAPAVATAATPGEALADRFNQRQYAYLLGRRCEREIRTDDGRVLIGRGQLIEAATIEAAQAAGKFMELAISSRTGGTLAGQPAQSSYAA